MLPISDIDGIITSKSSKSSEYQKLNNYKLLILTSPIQTPDEYPYLLRFGNEMPKVRG